MTMEIEEWLEDITKKDITKKIIEIVSRYRFDEELAGQVIEEEKFSDYIFLKKGVAKIESLRDGSEMVTLPPLVTQPIDADKILIKADLGDWADDPKNRTLDLMRIGKTVVDREATVLINGLTEGAKEVKSETNNKISKSDVRGAANWLMENSIESDSVSNIVVLNPLLKEKLEGSGEIVEAWRIPQGDRSTPHFAGLMASLPVFWTPNVPPNIALVYNKDEACLRRTKLSIEFSRPQRKASLWLREERKAWLTDPNALVKIIVKG